MTKLCLPVLAAVLLAALAAGATATPPPGATAVSPPAATDTVALAFEPPTRCQAASYMAATAPLLPAPRPRTAAVYCGSCSTPVCRGLLENSVCLTTKYGIYTCIPAYGNVCSDLTEPTSVNAGPGWCHDRLTPTWFPWALPPSRRGSSLTRVPAAM
jgi:hypothetical protein